MDKGIINVIKLDGCSYQGTTNIRNLVRVYFSVKKNKFIIPVRRYGDRVSGWFEYHLLPGRYIVFNFSYWSKGTPSTLLTVELVELKKNGEMEVFKSTKIEGSREEVKEAVKTLGISILEDFLRAVPGYHEVPGIRELSNKVYSDCELFNLFSFVSTYNNETFRKK